MKKIKRLFIFLLFLIIFIIGAGIWYGHGYYEKTVAKTPIEKKVREIRTGHTFVKAKDIPQNYIKAVVAVEDRRYYNHGPVDAIGIFRALVSNAKNKELQEGGSTITQQVAKNMYYINDNSDVVRRKVAEVFTAIDLEKKYNKDDILELYANIIYFGNGYYGINQACQGYLHKEPKEMTFAEAVMMAGIPNAPSVYAPTVNKDLCKKRLQKVLRSMVDNGDITQEQANKVDLSFIDDI